MSDFDIAQRQSLSVPATPTAFGPTSPSAQRAAAESGGVSCRLGDSSCAAAHAGRVSRSALGDGASLHSSLHRLQRDYGNQYVGQVLRQATGGDHDGNSMTSVERAIDGARGGGQGMDHGTRSRMESAFGADFSGVRIHDDSRADGLSRSLSARAFTTGSDVFFRQGEYSPGTSSGRELLAHELTHVVQQNGPGVQRKMTVSQPGDPHEVEADQMAHAVMQREHAQPVERQVVARSEDEDKHKHLAAKPCGCEVQRQPEAPRHEDDEEKKKLHRRVDATVVSLHEDENNQT